MSRNLRGRVEVVFPILDPALRRRVHRELIDLALDDRAKSRRMETDGNYVRRSLGQTEPETEMQQRLMRLVLGEEEPDNDRLT